MKNIIIVGSIIVLFVGYYFASPFIAFYSLRDGIQNGDSDKISQNVDFDALRRNLKDQLNAFQANRPAPDDNSVASLVKSFSPVVTSTLIDTFVTPKELCRILKGKSYLKDFMATENDETEKPDKGNSNREAKKDIFSRAQFSFSSPSRFVCKNSFQGCR